MGAVVCISRYFSAVWNMMVGGWWLMVG